MKSIVYYKLGKNIYILSCVKLFIFLGTATASFLSLYLTQNLLYSIVLSGVIVTLLNILSVPFTYIGGMFCEKYNAKDIIIVAQSISVVCCLSVAFMPVNILKICLLLLGLSISNMTIPAIDVCINVVSIKERRSESFSLMYFVQNIGVAIGGPIIGYAFSINPDYIFIGAAIMGAVSAFVMWLFFDKSLLRIKNYQAVEKRESSYGVIKLLRGFDKKHLFLIAFLNSLAYGQITFLLPLFLERIGIDKPASFYGIIISINSVAVIILSPILTAVFAKQKLEIPLFLAEISFVIGYVGYVFSDTLWLFVIFTVFWTIGEILFMTNGMAYLVVSCKERQVGMVSSCFTMAMKVGGMLSSIGGVALLNAFDPVYIWLIISICPLMGVFLMVKNKRI